MAPLASISLLSLAIALTHAKSYTVGWDSGMGLIVAFSGDITIPSVASDTSAQISASLQSYVGGSIEARCVEKGGGWWIGIGDDGFSVQSGKVVHFSFAQEGASWTASLGNVKKKVGTNGSINRVVLGVDTTGSIDFGPVTFTNIKMETQAAPPGTKGADMGWCKRIQYTGDFTHQISGPEVSDQVCEVGSAILG
ncbi:hypothetical protein Moror_2977 [Moniliophthora roreri MCA 2997]|uniref:Uncharacterized protein n=2 Tax=Moniliophthora roreri TaxID=221103 RepID=V2X8D5_MONRO|nr:hypothetical protein Moror_2977 [Moniliophthora roreri MCA 2997]